LIYGANPQCVDGKGYTPLHRAVKKKQPLVAQILLSNGAQVDQIGGPDDSTALHLAAKNCDAECISILVLWNANKNIKNKNDETPEEIVRVLDPGIDFSLAFTGFGLQLEEKSKTSSTVESTQECSSENKDLVSPVTRVIKIVNDVEDNGNKKTVHPKPPLKDEAITILPDNIDLYKSLNKEKNYRKGPTRGKHIKSLSHHVSPTSNKYHIQSHHKRLSDKSSNNPTSQNNEKKTHNQTQNLSESPSLLSQSQTKMLGTKIRN